MTEYLDTPARARHDEAAYWQARMMSGKMRDEELEAFKSWLAASPRNREAYAGLQEALALVDEAGDALLAEEFEAELEDRAQVQSNGFVRYGAVAASLALMLAAAFAIRHSVSVGEEMLYATAVGELDRVALEDGSVVELNTHSAIEVAFSRNRRDINLRDGQALFTVERDRNRPFVVATANAEIVVTGTVFDVEAYDGEAIVSVISGVVDVRPNAGPAVTLLAGDRVVVDVAGVASPVDRFDANQSLSWRNGKLRYREAPLGEVVEDLNRYFAKPIMLDDPALAGLPVSGEFDTHDQGAALSGLSLIFSLASHEEADRFVLARRENAEHAH